MTGEGSSQLEAARQLQDIQKIIIKNAKRDDYPWMYLVSFFF